METSKTLAQEILDRARPSKDRSSDSVLKILICTTYTLRISRATYL